MPPTVLITHYYDTYDFLGINGIPNNSTTTYTKVSNYEKRHIGGCRGQQTGIWAAQLNGQAGNTVYSKLYYDYRYRIIQQKGNNSINGPKQMYTAYNFEGSPQKRNLKNPDFTQNLYYENGPGIPCYNGNISAIKWKTSNETNTRGISLIMMFRAI